MDDVHASVAESRTNLTQAMTGGDQQGAELAALTPGSFYVSTEKAVLQARAPGPADPEAGVRIDDVLEDDEPGLFPSDFEERVQNWIRRNEQGPVHPCHWLVFAVLGILFALSLGCWALTLHEYKVSSPRLAGGAPARHVPPSSARQGRCHESEGCALSLCRRLLRWPSAWLTSSANDVSAPPSLQTLRRESPRHSTSCA